MSFEKILVANRGEIAVRVMGTAQSMGYRTVAVYTQADALAPHVSVADEAVLIGEGPVADSYLDIERILNAAKKVGADAVHPGYGFLSENSDFAEQCEQAGITFIGPSAQAIYLMGSKRQSKIAMQQAGVPCIPGYEGEDQSQACLLAEGERIGFPLMVKASAGGGGRGMRLVTELSLLAESLDTARSEAQAAFGSGELILEKAVINPRHIEIQVFADQQGNVIHLGERDCSIQRRHQKVVEEAPSPFVDQALREKMGAAAVAAAKACQYCGAGTVEFLVDENKQFYFLEMNTRLQVEHPVTEMVTGLDLVEWQLRVAAGEPLALQQEEVSLNGHAIEVRLYAEDPRNQFLPQTGDVLCWQPAGGDGIRVDRGIQQGQTISAFYDPMVAKVVAWGADREQARRRLVRAVEDTVLLGVNHNKAFLANVLRHERFVSGEATTAFIERDFSEDASLQPLHASVEILGVAGVLTCCQAHQNGRSQGWASGATLATRILYQQDEGTVGVQVVQRGQQQFHITVGQEQRLIQVLKLDSRQLVYLMDSVRKTAHYTHSADQIHISLDNQDVSLRNVTQQAASALKGAGSDTIVASMDGAIVQVAVEEGQAVSRGQTLVVLEAMKMEHQLKADADGVVEKILVAPSQQVKGRQLLVQLCLDNG